jgi:hypothetical protein
LNDFPQHVEEKAITMNIRQLPVVVTWYRVAGKPENVKARFVSNLGGNETCLST